MPAGFLIKLARPPEWPSALRRTLVYAIQGGQTGEPHATGRGQTRNCEAVPLSGRGRGHWTKLEIMSFSS